MPTVEEVKETEETKSAMPTLPELILDQVHRVGEHYKRHGWNTDRKCHISVIFLSKYIRKRFPDAKARFSAFGYDLRIDRDGDFYLAREQKQWHMNMMNHTNNNHGHFEANWLGL
jgi:hypothetical protein